MHPKLFTTIIFSALFCLTSFGQVELRMLSPKKMKKDLKMLLELVEAHPDPYTKISEEAFNDLVAGVEENINVEMDLLEFYKIVSPIITSIQDGHTSLRMPRYWLQNKQKKHGAFPYEVFLTNEGTLHIIQSYGDQEIPLCAEILEINGMSIPDFITEVDPCLSYETIPFRNDRISESFEFLLYLVFKQVDQLSFKFRVSEEQTVVVSTLPYNDWKEQKKDLEEEREKKIARSEPYDFSIIKPGVALINIFSFSVGDITKYNFFLNKTFKEIKNEGVHSLIIDVRGNYGGWPRVSSELFHYIHEGHFKVMAKSSMKISQPYRRYFTEKMPKVNTVDVTFQQRRHNLNLQEILYGELNTYVDEDDFYNESNVEEEYEFSGDCYLLMDRKSYSASSSFASTFQCYSMGTIIGEPSGGTKIFRANSIYKRLPSSSFFLGMSTSLKYCTCYNEENEPVLPDFEVTPSILDRVHKSDAQLNFTLMLIQKLQNGEISRSRVKSDKP